MATKDDLAQAFGQIASIIARIESESASRDLQLAEANVTIVDQVSSLTRRLDALEVGTPAPSPEPAPEPAPEPPPPPTFTISPAQPFNAGSVWRTKIPDWARRELDPASQRLRDWKRLGRGINIGRNDYTIGVYQAEESDPLVEVLVQSPDSRNPGRVGTVRLHMPDDAIPSPGSDGHCTIIDPSRDLFHEFWWLQANKRRAGSYMVTRIDGSGIELEGGLGWGACRAYGGSSTAGLIRAGELEHGIEHMLLVGAPSADMTSPFVWPASHDDGGSHYGPGGTIPTGTIFTLPLDFDLAGLSTPMRHFAIAKRDYGLMVGDKAGRNWQGYMELGHAEELVDAAPRWRDELGYIYSQAVTLKGVAPTTPKG